MMNIQYTPSIYQNYRTSLFNSSPKNSTHIQVWVIMVISLKDNSSYLKKIWALFSDLFAIMLFDLDQTFFLTAELHIVFAVG